MTDGVDFQTIQQRAAESRRPVFGGDALIVCDNLVKIYKVGDLEVVALQGLDLLVEDGEFIAIVGTSGSGKSTLLNILGGLDVPTAEMSGSPETSCSTCRTISARSTGAG